MGPLEVCHLRRDFMLAIKYGLEDCGHDVILNGQRVDASRTNIIICPNWFTKDVAKQLVSSKIKYISVNTEIIADGMLNYKPEKCDFEGVFLPVLKSSIAVWDVVQDNLPQYEQYGLEANFMRWGYHEKMHDIESKEKNLDFYFFGTMSARRQSILKKLVSHGLYGEVDEFCPTFVRNDKIARAKVQLNIAQDDKYSHVNSFRTCYLSNNNCYVVSEPENDPAGYLESVDVVNVEKMADHIKKTKEQWKDKAEENCAKFKKHHMRDCMERLLEATF